LGLSGPLAWLPSPIWGKRGAWPLLAQSGRSADNKLIGRNSFDYLPVVREYTIDFFVFNHVSISEMAEKCRQGMHTKKSAVCVRVGNKK
jgi:hypothetical protein